MTASVAPDPLLAELHGQRWFAGDAEPVAARVAEVAHADAELELLLVEVCFADAPERTYVVARAAGGGDALSDLPALRRLTQLAGVETPCRSVRPAGVEQSNSAVVVDDAVVLKLYRRVEPGPGVEAELLGALGRAGFGAAPPLLGVLEHGSAGTTIAIVTGYVPSAGDGWELTLAGLRGGDADWLPQRARALGETTGAMHAALARATEPALAPAVPDPGAAAGVVASLDQELAEAGDLPGLPPGSASDLRELLAELAGAVVPSALAVRIHGDYHLGQVLWSDAGEWVVIDLEGEPARPLAERRRPTFALRDVAGMLRSFAYAADGSELLGGTPAPVGWETACRTAFLDGWRATVDPRLVPASETAAAAMLRLCELQKLVYELRYELSHRPDWVRIPLAGLRRILEAA